MLNIFRRKPSKEQLARVKHSVDEVKREQEASLRVQSMYRIDFELPNLQTHVYNEMASSKEELEKKVKRYYILFLKDKWTWVNPWVEYKNGDQEGSFNLNYV